MGNEWARLFGAGRTCNRFMHQPACERVACERIGGVAIANCAPLSSAVQRSFAGAVVEEVVIRGSGRLPGSQTARRCGLRRGLHRAGHGGSTGSVLAGSSSSSDAHRHRQRPALAAQATCGRRAAALA
jgi:hypothetical protein